MTPPLESLSDSALSEAVAIEVAGFSDVRTEEMENVDYESRSVSVWKEVRGTINGERKRVPDFSTSADAVLPLLDQWRRRPYLAYAAQIDMTCDGWTVKLCDGSLPDSPFWHGSAPTLPRAICIALLKAARANKK